MSFLSKLMTSMGIAGIASRNIQNTDFTPQQLLGTAGGSKAPLAMRTARRRKKNKAARKARRNNR